MTLALPAALLALLLLPALWILHRRARPHGDRPFSAWFLVVGVVSEGAAGRRVRAPLLLTARAVAVVALTVAAVGPRCDGAGTLAVVAGPFEVDPAWPAPLTIVRAGRPPTEVEADAPVPEVAGPPDWATALLLGRRLAPEARLVRPAAAAPAARVVAAGAALVDDAVAISVSVEGPGRPSLEVGARRVELTARNGDWFHHGDLPAGPATVVLGERRWPLCLPDARPLPVADAGWPSAVEALLEVLPGVRRVPAEQAAWRVGPPLPVADGRALFAPARVHFDFRPGAPESSPATLSFGEGLPPPGAVVRRWRALRDPGEPLLYAGDAVVADVRAGPDGATRRFGFVPADTDLVETAGWPVLFLEALDADRAARGRCLTHVAGAPLRLTAAGPIRVEAPNGRSWNVKPGEPVPGLDLTGHYRLTAQEGEAWLAVVPPPLEATVARADIAAPTRAPAPLRRPWLAAALLALVASFALGRLRAPLVWLAVALAGLAYADPPLPLGPPGGVALAVDVSGSMPAAETEAAVEVVSRALGDRIVGRVDGADRVLGAGAGPGRRGAGESAPGTRAGPLLAAAAELAGPGGAVVWISDGRAEDAPTPTPRPVIALPVRSTRPDAWIESAGAVRIGEQVFARVEVAADRTGSARVWLGDSETRVDVHPGRPVTVRAVLPYAGAALRAEVQLEGDRLPANDRWPVAVQGEPPGEALVLGPGAAPWVAAAGLRPTVRRPEALLEEGARLSGVRAMALHDVAAESLPSAVRPRLRRWVESGGLLLLAGRTRAFAPGGWSGTALDQLSPLAADPRPPGEGRVGVVLLLDRSGSMATEAGGPGAEGVARLAGRLAGALGPDDRLGVVGFGAGVDVLLAPRPAGEVDRIPAPALTRGGTRLLPALRRGLALLESAPVQARVLVVVTDGRVVDAPAELDAARAELAEAGARLVVALIGEDPSREILTPIAGEASVLRIADPEAAPALMAAGVLGAAGGLFAEGGVVREGEAWAARVGGPAPPVPRRVRVRAREEARVLARVGGEPLLAEWSVGSGRVVALATDQWALSADQWAALLAPASAPRARIARIAVVGETLVFDGPALDPPPGAATLLEPDGRAVRVRWRATGPGRAVAPLPPGPPAVLEVETATPAGAVLATVTRPPPEEVRRTGPDAAMLMTQAALSGGRYVTDLAELPAAVDAVTGRRRGSSPAPLLAVLAALMLLGDAWRWARGDRGSERRGRR